MNSGRNRLTRTVIALLFIALCTGFLSAGIPAAGFIASAAANVGAADVAKNTNPIAKNQDYTTYKGILIRGKMEAVDPDGDKVSFEVTAFPKKGALESQGTGGLSIRPTTAKRAGTPFLM